MNLFCLGWGLSAEISTKMPEVLAGLVDVYPMLDESTLEASVSEDGGATVASIQVPRSATGSRLYWFATDQDVTLFDGCPVDPHDSIRGHNARDLAHHWADIPERLDGQYVAAKCCRGGDWMEVVTDPLGVHQTYVMVSDGAWAVSNSVQVLLRLLGTPAVDPVAVAMWAGIGFVCGNRTMHQGIEVLPPGVRWQWTRPQGHSEVVYFPRSDLAGGSRGRLTEERVADLGHRLGGGLRVLADRVGTVECPITAGRDSRMMVALMLRFGVPGEYFSAGTPGSADLEIGTRIAEHFELPHATGDQLDDDFVVRSWDSLSSQFLLRTDGMVTLEHIVNAFAFPEQVTNFPVHLYGAGGEIARGYYTDKRWIVRSPDVRTATDYLKSYFLRKKHRSRLLTPEGLRLAEAYLEQFVERTLSSGFEPEDVPDVFYLGERVRRWAGSNFRPPIPFRSVYSPFCSRSYAEVAFSLSLARRYSEHLPHELLRWCAPELSRIPMEKPWRFQNPAALKAGLLAERGGKALRRRLPNVLSRMLSGKGPPQRQWRAQRRFGWFERKREDFRELCLDQDGSSVWECVDRTRIEELLNPDTDPSLRAGHLGGLYGVLTMVQYENLTTTS